MKSFLNNFFVKLLIVSCHNYFTVSLQDISPITPSNLRVEYLAEPLSIGIPNPRFSFVVNCSNDCPRGTLVHGYRIVVSNSKNKVIWDSGSVQSKGRTSQIEFGETNESGKLETVTPLEPNADYSWTAQWFDESQKLSGAAESTFSTALFTEQDWQGAMWIGTSEQRHLKLNFDIPNGTHVTRARAFVAAPGCHTLYVNKYLAGDRMGVCPWTQFEKRILYQTHDLDSYFMAGASNQVDLYLGLGMWGAAAKKTNPTVRVRSNTLCFTIS